MPTEELRLEPIGKDQKGFSYWYQIDELCNVRVYREDPDEETWDLIAKYVEVITFCLGAYRKIDLQTPVKLETKF